MSGRLTYYHDFLRELNSWDYIFGTQLPDYALDSSYLILLSAFGISYILILTALLIKAVINNKNKFALTILFSLMCYGVTEAVMARAEIPVTILFISLMFINTNKKQSSLNFVFAHKVLLHFCLKYKPLQFGSHRSFSKLTENLRPRQS